jgi:hypothetical protein
MLGLGAFCIGEDMTIIDHYLEQATQAICADVLEAGSLTLVQGFTLLSNLAQKRNKPNTGSTYLGIAVRMAIGLGLHRELPFWRISAFEREVRRRVWWVVFIFDSGACITFGRPIVGTSRIDHTPLCANSSSCRMRKPMLTCRIMCRIDSSALLRPIYCLSTNRRLTPP